MRPRRRLPVGLRLGIVAVGAIALLVAATGLRRVAPGNEALRVGRGGDISVLPAGWHFVAPGAALIRYPVGAHSYRVPATGTVPVIFGGGESLPAAFRFDLDIPAGVSPVIYQRLSRDFESAFTRVVVSAAELEAAALAQPDAGGFERAVVARVRGEMEPLGIATIDGRLVRLGERDWESAERAVQKKVRAPRRVIVVGVDGGDWVNLRPLIDAGELPNFARLLREGATGPLRSEEPMLSPLLWTTMATGRYPEDHGVLDFTVVDPVTGLRVPIGRRYRKVDAFWNMLTGAGQRVGVVGWLATDPAEEVDGVMVTDRFGYLAYAREAAPAESSSVFPPERRDELSEHVVRARDVADAEIMRFVRVPRAELARHRGEFDPKDPINNLAHLYASTRTFRNIALHLLDHDSLDALAVYFEWIDAMSHLFMLHAPPRMPDVPVNEFERYRFAVEEAYALQDEILGEIMSRVDERTVLMVISDHGFKSGSVRLRNRPEIWAGNAAKWHRIEGMLAFYGAGVRKGAAIENASILDVAPTLLALMGLPRAADMPGTVVRAAFEDEVASSFATETVPTLDRARRDVAEVAPGGSADAETMKKLQALGYLAPDDADAHNNLGQRYEQRGEFEKAIEEYQKAIALRPNFHATYNNLAVCYGKLKMYPQAQAALEKCIELNPQNFAAMTNLAVLLIETGRLEAGLRLAERVVKIEPAYPNGRVTLGSAYLLAGRYDEAERELREALRLDPENAEAKVNLQEVARVRGGR